MTDVYTAIMKAADHIERHPAQFDFKKPWVPATGKCVGCALGWVGFFSGMRTEDPVTGRWNSHHEVAVDVLHVLRADNGDNLLRFGCGSDSVHLFYARLNGFVGSSWCRDAKLCATALRRYAETYHKPLPTAITQIFTPENDHVIES